jgi:hypothetical protein
MYIGDILNIHVLNQSHVIVRVSHLEFKEKYLCLECAAKPGLDGQGRIFIDFGCLV